MRTDGGDASTPDDMNAVTSSRDDLERAAIQVLATNWRGASTVPAATLYPHQWSWDSAFIAIGASHWSQRRAETELLSLFGAQWADGRVPHIVFNPEVADDAYFPGPRFWRSSRVPGSPASETSGIVQPPVHARAALDVLRNAREPDRAAEFLRRLYPRLVAQHRYLEEHRVVDGLDLAAIIHPWESGLDNSPLWDEPLSRVPADPVLMSQHTRRDIDHAPHTERPGNDDYARYIRLAAAYRDADYDDARHFPSSEFTVVDPLFNALWVWSEEALVEIAEVIGADPEPHRVRAAALTRSLAAGLFDGHLRGFVAHDVRTATAIHRRTVGGLVPIVLEALPPAQVEAISAQLASRHFGLLDDDVTGVPSYDLRAADFDGRRYWRGPTWLNTNWVIWRGLRRHGLDEPADALATAMVDLVETSGFREYFDPRTRSGHGATEFSWTAALILDVLHDDPTLARAPSADK